MKSYNGKLIDILINGIILLIIASEKSRHSGIYFPFYTYFQMSSVTCFSLDHSKFWFSGDGLNGCELKSRPQTGKKIFRETEKLLVTCKFSFIQNVFFAFWFYFPVYTYFQTSFATCFNLDQSNFWLYGNRLNV